jgi:hypothetical protein
MVTACFRDSSAAISILKMRPAMANYYNLRLDTEGEEDE